MSLRPLYAYKGISFLLLLFLFPACSDKQKEVHVLRGKKVLVIEPVPVDTMKPPVNPDTSYLEHVFSGYGLTNVLDLDSNIRVDLRYADTLNFLKRNFYDGLRKAYMTCEMAIRFCNAQYYLKKIDSTLNLVVLDAARPLHIQQMMWDSLELIDEEKRKYLTPPELSSLHNYGCAVDVSIESVVTGKLLDMGSGFDQFDSISQPRFEKQFLKAGRLDSTNLYNRKLLRYVMKTAGLRDIVTEWWHFSLCSKKEAAKVYELIR